MTGQHPEDAAPECHARMIAGEVRIISIVKRKDARTGITYVYESVSYWDKGKQQPRSKRKLIGKIDEATGEIVPTRRHKTKEEREAEADAKAILNQKDFEIDRLTLENKMLRAEIEAFRIGLNTLLSRSQNKMQTEEEIKESPRDERR